MSNEESNHDPGGQKVGLIVLQVAYSYPLIMEKSISE